MAHHGISRHHRWSKLMRRRNHSLECNGENGGQASHCGQGSPVVSAVKHSMFVSASEADEHDSASHDPDLPVLKRQEIEAVQSGASQEPAATRTSTVADTTADTTGILTQPNGNHTITTHISSTALNHTTAPPNSTAPPTSTVSTDSSILTLSIHSPDPSLATSSTLISQTSLTADTSSLTSGLSSSTAHATPTAAQSSPLISHTIPSSIAASSNSFISKSSTRPTATTAAATATESIRISSSGSTDSTDSTDTSPTTSFFNEASTTSTSTYFESLGPTGSLGGFAGGGAAGSGPSTTGSSAEPTATDSQPPQDSGGLSPTTNKIVGGVVGSVAGVAFLFLIALLYLRRRHASLREARQALPSSDAAGGAAGEGSTAQSAEMTSRRSSHEPLFSASYLAPAFMRSWRKSNQTTNTESTLVSNSSERGFQKISGRKIPSVLQSGGDGYGGGFGDNLPPGPEMSMNFQPVSAAHLRTPASQPPTANPHGMPLDVNYTRESGESELRVVVRPSPARTPVASSTNIASSHTPTSPRSTPEPPRVSSPTGPRRPDILGRSHPSFDGSRSSRFTEGL